MTKEIKISDDLFIRLQGFAIPLIDTPETVIKRLIDHYDSCVSQENKPQALNIISSKTQNQDNDVLDRVSRQRGITVKLNEEVIKAESLSDLYKKVMENLYNLGRLDEIKHKLPISTSRQRFLISMEPTHPGGNNFVVPVEFKGYYMEAHKDYKTGVKHLRKLVEACGLYLTIQN